MGRPATGQVVVDKRRTSATFGLRFRAYGERHYVTLGTAADGWTQAKAQTELQNVLADVRRGMWSPPSRAPARAQPKNPTFHEFSSEWFEAKRTEIRPNTARSYKNDLTHHLLPFFEDHRLTDITIAEVDRYRQTMVRRGELKARTINMHLALLAQILEVAVEYDYLARNPAAGRRRRLKAPRPRPVYLDTAEHLEAMLEAAGKLDAENPRTRGRRAAITVLLFGGLRAEEVGALRWRDVDLANGRLHVHHSKTDAGTREVDLLPLVREQLTEHKAASAAAGPDDPVFVTSGGKARDRHNLRQRVVAPVVRRADVLLAKRGGQPLPTGLSPHKLRHTFASLLVALGNDAAYVMAQLGHTDPAFTLRVYTHIMRRDPGERERLRTLVEGRSAESRAKAPPTTPSKRPSASRRRRVTARR
jgi:integrase